ncbi:MAG: S41 family peptidase [Acidobacteria bacterium]|nr:S41 family peptidase [Acidobacteriota bacterium]
MSAARESRQPDRQLDGVWQELAYGRIIKIHARGFDLYHTTKLLCYRDPTGTDLALDSRYSHYELAKGGRLTLYFHDLGENTRRFQNGERFRRLPKLPAACVDSLSTSEYRNPVFIFDLFWQTFKDHYAFFSERGIDWDAVRSRYRARVTPSSSHDELFDLFREMLGSLNDGHVHLYLGTKRHFQAGRNVVRENLQRAFEAQKSETNFGQYVSAWAGRLKATVSSGLLQGPVHRAANDTIWWGSLNDRIGYVNVYLLTNFIENGGWKSRSAQLRLVDETFDQIFEEFQGKSAVLLDLTHNQGGFDAASELIAGRFADRARHALTIRPILTKPEKLIVYPSSRARFTKPVYVLTSPITVSAGEGLVAMLKPFPHVKQIGERTRGYLSGILNKPLPADFAVSVTSQRFTTPDGKLLEVAGNEPDIPLDVFPANDMDGGYRRALDRAVALIMSDILASHPR